VRRKVMRKLIFIGMAVVFILPALACGGTPQPTNTPAPPPTATNTPLPPPPTPTNTPEPFVGGECDPVSERVEMNTRVTRAVQGGTYPETCEVYCLWVPDGSRLEIGISDFNVDLDIYVDIDLSVLQFEDHGRWESNAYGTGDEQVRINSPDGRYYMQVCSYEGVPSSFSLWNEFTP
jgi:hypothetical protein